MARAALDWSTQDLAEAAAVGVNTVNRFETGQDARLSSVEKIKLALEAAGIEFLSDERCEGVVRLRVRLDTAADLTRRIDTIEDDLAESKGPSARTPAGGMRTLERAHKREAVTKLKNRRAKLGKTKK